MKTFMVIAVVALSACSRGTERPTDVRRVDDVVVCAGGLCSVIFDNGKNGNVNETRSVKRGDVVCLYFGLSHYELCREVR